MQRLPATHHLPRIRHQTEGTGGHVSLCDRPGPGPGGGGGRGAVHPDSRVQAEDWGEQGSTVGPAVWEGSAPPLPRAGTRLHPHRREKQHCGRAGQEGPRAPHIPALNSLDPREPRCRGRT
uniref:Uncharacterized protein n=1 Tax=Rousettus aegyptiacus TaxID=9407 RepID=A0A7J8H0P4_ROUAE|nr:hypothetical protein HJG63_011161 [Rousettus aegyptiacus]